MPAGYVFLGVLAFIAIMILVTCLKIVPQSQAYVMELLGKYSGTWKEGLHFKKPFIERIVK
jgi:regulator of protease activity HflC (stomatin/prohibitin superfamily)